MGGTRCAVGVFDVVWVLSFENRFFIVVGGLRGFVLVVARWGLGYQVGRDVGMGCLSIRGMAYPSSPSSPP